MSDEPTERDVEALTKVVDGAPPPSTRNIARHVLTSDWLAERDAQQRREGAVEVEATVDALADEYAATGSPYLIQRDVIVADLRAIRGDA